MQDIRIRLQPKQKQFLKSIENVPITLFGGARGGGKSYSIRNIFLARRLQFPNSAGAIFRRTFPELEANHIRPLFQEHPYLRQFWSESKRLLSLPNGSTLQFCHCSNEDDIGLYQGREISDLGIDEAGQFTEGMFRTLLGSNRSSIKGVPVRCALTANPGGVGHAWLKRIFIERRFNERERPKDYAFIQSLVQDNQALIANDPDYVHRLQSEPNEALRKAFLYGDWNIFAGQFFQEISKEVHVIKPFKIPEHWNRFGAYDYGFNHPAAFGWFANDEDGNTYLYRELIKARMRVDQFARELNTFPDTAKLYPIVAGHDCWTTKNTLREDVLPPTIAEEFLTHGLQLNKAVIDRVQGASHLRSYLSWKDKNPPKPRFYIFDTCPITFDAISRMIHNPDKVEDVLKVDASDGDPLSGDDAYDMVRYGLMSRPAITESIRQKIVIGSRDWHVKENEKLFEKEIEKYDKMREESGDWPEMYGGS